MRDVPEGQWRGNSTAVQLLQGSLATDRNFIYDDGIVMIFNHKEKSWRAAMIDQGEGELDVEEYLLKHTMDDLSIEQIAEMTEEERNNYKEA